ncbi:MAG: RsiV family protein [Proteiniphilum sp.]|nr:RsiV family protein [Proteiniphilum sp.]
MLSPVILLFVITCSRQGRLGTSNAENSVRFDTVSLTARHHLDGDTAKPCCNIKVKFIYPVGNGKAVPDMLQQFFIRNTFGAPYDTLTPPEAADAYVRNYIENYTADAKTYRDDETEDPDADHTGHHHGESSFYSYYEDLSVSIVYNRHGILSFQVKQSNNKGGAASYDSFHNYVLNLQTGRQVMESDLFDAGYDTALQRLIIASLLDQARVKSVEELEDLGFFGVREIIPNSNFLLNGEGIIYIYNKGEYSAYQLDAPQVFIPYELIRSLLKQNSVASQIAGLQ